MRAVIFDCFGVLTTDWWKEFLASIPEGEAKEEAKRLNHTYDAGIITLEDFVKALHIATGADPKPVEDIFRTPKPEKNLELLDYIRTLKPKYKIGMLSNVGTNWVREHFLTGEEQKLFDAIILSYDVGYTKPSPEIYKIALQKLDTQPTETVFIDDSPKYAHAAEELGLKGIIYEDFAQMKVELEKMLVT